MKFLDFSLACNFFHFPDIFPWTWQPWECRTWVQSSSHLDLSIPTAARQRLYEDRMRLWTETIPGIMTKDKTRPKSNNGGRFSSAAKLCVYAKVQLILSILSLQMVYLIFRFWFVTQVNLISWGPTLF